MKPPFRYEKLGYCALNVSSLERSVPFYRDLMGLDLVEQKDDVAYLRCSSDHHNLVLYQSDTPGLKRVANKMATAEDLKAAYEFYLAEGLHPEWLSMDECTELRQGPTFRVREPQSGVMFECYDRMTHLALPYVPTVTKIARLGHVVVGSPNYEKAVHNLNTQFNFAISDFVEHKFSWMRCFPNPLHHTFAIGNSDRQHLHHVNFMVTDIDDIGKAINRLQKAGVKIVFGPGRHLPSTSIFLYFLDPDGMTMEFSFGMEELHEDSARLPRMLEMHPNTMDIWGSSPDIRFGKTGMIEVQNA
ncbi:MAG: VOC family protein [Proteobacteria bacterium]|nr:VOC family protein [Pseudomonadota bacterium]